MNRVHTWEWGLNETMGRWMREIKDDKDEGGGEKKRSGEREREREGGLGVSSAIM